MNVLKITYIRRDPIRRYTNTNILKKFFFTYNRFYVLVEVVKAHIDGKIIVEQKQKEKKLIVVQTNRLHGRVARVQLTGSKMT
jgi:hypothetical protein